MKLLIGILFLVSWISPQSTVDSPQATRVPCSPRSMVDGQQAISTHLRDIIKSDDLHDLVPVAAVANHLNCGPRTMDCGLPLAAALHDYHMSNIDIEYNAETQALEIIAKIFIDDLEDGIAASGVEEKLYLCTDREVETGDDQVYAYLQDKMKIGHVLLP